MVASDSDELEGRFPAGKVNLNTSSLYYDALNSAAMLGKDLGKSEPAVESSTRSRRQEAAQCDRQVLRRQRRRFRNLPLLRRQHRPACLDLHAADGRNLRTAGKGTIEALFSPRLWTQDGLASQAGDKTFWDRATLYALRGVLAAGETQRAIPYLSDYSNRRLLGDHVPYPVEAWPEGNQRHLAAESALYCRIYTEGLFGIRPTGLRSFVLTPRLPAEWNSMGLKSVRAFGHDFDIAVTRAGDKQSVEVTSGGRKVFSEVLAAGEAATVSFGE